MKELYNYISFLVASFVSSFVLVFILAFAKQDIPLFVYILNIGTICLVWAIFFQKYIKDKKIYSNAIFVQGEVKKDSIECFHIGKGIYFVWADVTYSTKENNSVIVAKASFWDIHGFSWRVMNRDKDFSVLIGYNPNNGKESIVYLKEAFERTS
ncbi:MAG: hypothetical protein J6K43_09735 [Lachnospiraceae bacterium]|nr:hypothetical protein [Lachnospiraceae bacterium]